MNTALLQIVKQLNSLVSFEHDIIDTQFESCDFTNLDLSEMMFENVVFINCNLSFAKLNKTSFRKVEFVDCKLLAVQFDQCNTFGFRVQFKQCILNQSSFVGIKMRQTSFKECKLQEVDFSEVDLSGSTFEYCDFAAANFDYTNLEGADFRSSKNYNINPTTNKIKHSKFSYPEVLSLLNIFEITIEQ